MRIAHLSASISVSGGGVSIALKELTRAQEKLDIRLAVVGHRDQGQSLTGWPLGCPDALEIKGLPGLPWAPAMRDRLRDFGPDLLHVHGLWGQPSVEALGAESRWGCPFVVSPHGMLDPWALSLSKWKKRIARRLFEDRHLRRAACLHALCRSEMTSIRALGLKGPIAIIPNGIELPEIRDQKPEVREDKKTLLFLGRLHPKKGLVNALQAWASLQKTDNRQPTTDNWNFVIAGWDQGGHRVELEQLCREIGVSVGSVSVDQFLSASPKPRNTEAPASVLFVGPAFGEQKDALLRRASAFILPSFSEGLPMSVLEAWSYGLPVLMTDHCNLPEGLAAEAALRIGTDSESIAEGMRQLFSLPTTDNGQSTTSLASLGANGRALVERQFTWPQVASQMKEVYEWVLGGGEVPNCVREF